MIEYIVVSRPAGLVERETSVPVGGEDLGDRVDVRRRPKNTKWE